MTTSDLAMVWTYFADTSCGAYSPLYDRISRTVAANEAVLELIDDAPPESHLPTVLLAAVHYLLLAGAEHPLAAVYDGTSDADPGPLFVDFCLAHRDEILQLMATEHTNTNEVGRSAFLGPAITEVAAREQQPVALVDVGCSAGLNLFCDRYRLDYGTFGASGPPDAAVTIDCEVTGGHPPIAPQLPVIAARVGIDRDPVDITDEHRARWLLACVWPDTGRLPRTRRALAAARQDPPALVRGDAVATISDVVDGLPDDAIAVVSTTLAFAYFSQTDRVAFRDTLAALSRRRPIAWVSAEVAGVVAAFDEIPGFTDRDGTDACLLGLMQFRAGAVDADLLAYVHPHGAWIKWQR
jgi:hypothetical protein